MVAFGSDREDGEGKVEWCSIPESTARSESERRFNVPSSVEKPLNTGYPHS